MAVCINCHILLHTPHQLHEYLAVNLNPELVIIIEEWCGREISDTDCLCQQCACLVSREAVNRVEFPDVRSGRQYRHTCVCICCGLSLGRRSGRRRHRLIVRSEERRYIQNQIFPRQFPDEAWACHACWMRAYESVTRNSNMPIADPIGVWLQDGGSAWEAPGSVDDTGSVEEAESGEVAGAVEVCEGEFSWQRPAAVVPCDVDDAEWLSDEVVMFEPPSKPTAAVTEPALEPEPEPCHEGYRCNNCGGDIVGFRYVCVQCVDYDLCCTCEAAAAHAVHYVLRVPGPRPHSEVAAVLTTIRRALLADSILLVDGFQAEVKEEPDQPDPISLEATVEDQSQDGDDITSQDGDDVASQDGDDVASQDGDDVASQDGDDVASQDGDDVTSQDGDGVTSQDGDDITSQDVDEGSVASEDSCHPSGDDNSDTDVEQVTAHSSASHVSRTSSRTTTHMPKISLVPQNSLMTTTSSIIKTTPMSKPICCLDLTNNTIVVLGNKKPNISPETLRIHMSAQLRNLPQCTDKSRVAERNLPQSTEKSRVAERNLPQSTEKSRVAERNLPQSTEKSNTAEKRPMPVPVQVNKSAIQAVMSAKRARVNVERLSPAQLNSALDKR